MQAIHSIQNAMINASAGIQAALVVDAANAHRTYLPSFTSSRVVAPVVQRPKLGSPCSKPSPSGLSDSKQSLMRREGTGQERGGSPRPRRTWRLDASHQLPGTAWAMLVLNRSMCG